MCDDHICPSEFEVINNTSVGSFFALLIRMCDICMYLNVTKAWRSLVLFVVSICTQWRVINFLLIVRYYFSDFRLTRVLNEIQSDTLSSKRFHSIRNWLGICFASFHFVWGLIFVHILFFHSSKTKFAFEFKCFRTINIYWIYIEKKVEPINVFQIN